MQQPTVPTNQAFPIPHTQPYFHSQQTNAGNGNSFNQQEPIQYQTYPTSYPYPRPVVPQAIPQDDPDSHKETPTTPGYSIISNIGSKVVDAYGSVLVITS